MGDYAGPREDETDENRARTSDSLRVLHIHRPCGQVNANIMYHFMRSNPIISAYCIFLFKNSVLKKFF